MSAHTGKAPFLGVLMLDTDFPRVLGDAGNPESYPFPVRIIKISGAKAKDVVKPLGPDDALLAGFLAAARQLEAQGATALISTCGFLVYFQEPLARAVNIPVMVSALSLHPLLRQTIGNRPIGILTASAASLAKGGPEAAQINPDHVQIAGFEDCPAFADAILKGKATSVHDFDTAAICDYAVKSARALINIQPDIGCILLECGNLLPYGAAIRAATGLPVFSIMDAAQMFWNASESELFRS